MGTYYYFVMSYRGRWYVFLNGDRYGPFTSREDATQSALTVAQKRSSAKVHVQEPDDRFSTVWASEPDDTLDDRASSGR